MRTSPRAFLPPGITPQQASSTKIKTALQWLLLCHYSTEANVRRKLGISETGYLAQLQKKGLVRAVQAPSIRCNKVYMLTEDGLAKALSLSEELVDYDTDSGSIVHRLVKHQLAVQQAILALPNITEFRPERLIHEADLSGKKRPDALVRTAATQGHWAALEVELTPKRGRDLDQALLANVQSIVNRCCVAVLYVTNIQGIISCYRGHLDRPLPLWIREPGTGRWKSTGETLVISEDVRNRFHFVRSENLLRGL